MKQKSVLPALIDKLKDLGLYVCGEAACELGEIKNVRAIGPLIAVLKENVCGRRVVEALRSIKGQNHLRNATEWEDWWKENKKKSSNKTGEFLVSSLQLIRNSGHADQFAG